MGQIQGMNGVATDTTSADPFLVSMQGASAGAAAGGANAQFSDAFQKASGSDSGITSVNLNSASLGQILVASQALGLGRVSGFLETMSTDTDGSSATAHVLENSTTYNIPALFDHWADFDAAHGADQGAQQIRSIESTLVSHADANGNLWVDTGAYRSILAADLK